MPSRKQRRRRQKERRHEYEYVYVDAEGREVEIDPADEPEDPHPAPRAPRAEPRATPQRLTVGGRTIEPPSWRRAGKRALIFAPVMLIVMTLVYRDVPVAGHVLLTLQMLALFIPFSYLMDRMVYRRFLKRSGQAAAPQPARRR